MPKPPAAEAKAAKSYKHVTMRMDHVLWKSARHYAIDHHTSVSRLVADALRAYIAQPNGRRSQ